MAAVGRRAEARDAIALASVPIGVAIVLGSLLLPRLASPELVPVPVADRGRLAAAVALDHELAQRARRSLLPAEVRALGTAARTYHSLEAHGATPAQLAAAREDVDAALPGALSGGPDALLELRAVQLEGFLAEVDRFTETGAASEELEALAGDFLASLRLEGWCEGRRVAPDPLALRTLYKHMWNGFFGLEGRPDLAPSLDEERVYYAFALAHPHPTRPMRVALDAARRGAEDARACAALDEAERGATEVWRLGHIARLAAIDPAYPADYARGVASFRRGDFRASGDAFERWLGAHPDGPWTLRAQNFLRSARAAGRGE